MGVGMFPLILTVLNQDYGTPIIIPIKDCKHKDLQAAHPAALWTGLHGRELAGYPEELRAVPHSVAKILLRVDDVNRSIRRLAALAPQVHVTMQCFIEPVG